MDEKTLVIRLPNGEPTGPLSERVSLPLEKNPAAGYLASLISEGSRRVMRAALDTIADMVKPGADAFTFPWHLVRYQHATAIRAALMKTYAPATVNKMLSALRGTLKAAWGLKLMEAEEYQRARDVQNVKGETLPAGRELTPGEIGALLETCTADPSPAGVRDAAIIALLYGTGLRRAELVGLDLADFDAAAGRLVVRRGKGRKERTAYPPNGAARALADWLIVRGDDPGPLFYPINKGGRIQQQRLSTQAIYYILKKRGEQAGVKEFSPHDLRRTFVSDMLDAGADIAIVARIAGHAKVETTARYDRRPEEAKRRAAGLLHVPYRGRPDLWDQESEQ